MFVGALLFQPCFEGNDNTSRCRASRSSVLWGRAPLNYSAHTTNFVLQAVRHYGSSLTPRNAAKRCDDAKNNTDLTRAGASEGTTRSGTGPIKVQSQMGLPPVATLSGLLCPALFSRYFNAAG